MRMDYCAGKLRRPFPGFSHVGQVDIRGKRRKEVGQFTKEVGWAVESKDSRRKDYRSEQDVRDGLLLKSGLGSNRWLS